MKTGSGSAVGVTQDADGRVFMFDRAGNLYYDTGDKRLGFYIVSSNVSSLCYFAPEVCSFSHHAEPLSTDSKGLVRYNTAGMSDW